MNAVMSSPICGTAKAETEAVEDGRLQLKGATDDGAVDATLPRPALNVWQVQFFWTERAGWLALFSDELIGVELSDVLVGFGGGGEGGSPATLLCNSLRSTVFSAWQWFLEYGWCQYVCNTAASAFFLSTVFSSQIVYCASSFSCALVAFEACPLAPTIHPPPRPPSRPPSLPPSHLPSLPPCLTPSFPPSLPPSLFPSLRPSLPLPL